MANIPARLNDYAVYLSEMGRLTRLGTATVTMPTLEAMSDTVTGAGVLGEVETPTIGHFSSMEIELEWNTVTGVSLVLAAGHKKDIVIRADMQTESSAGHAFDNFRAAAQVRPKSTDIGSFEIASATGTTNTLEVTAINIFVNNVSAFELDKFNGIYKVGGKDMLKGKSV